MFGVSYLYFYGFVSRPSREGKSGNRNTPLGVEGNPVDFPR